MRQSQKPQRLISPVTWILLILICVGTAALYQYSTEISRVVESEKIGRNLELERFSRKRYELQLSEVDAALHSIRTRAPLPRSDIMGGFRMEGGKMFLADKPVDEQELTEVQRGFHAILQSIDDEILKLEARLLELHDAIYIYCDRPKHPSNY
ncbi:MAG: hypothetical protein AMXMBFR7_04400 [Planctomycetota bacterium]